MVRSWLAKPVQVHSLMVRLHRIPPVFHFPRETGHEQCALLRCPPGSLDPRDYKHEGTHRSGIDGEMQQAVTLLPQVKKVLILPAVQQHIHKQEQWKEVKHSWHGAMAVPKPPNGNE